MLITGDDILIEYVDRLMNTLKTVNDDLLQESWKSALDKFITHYVWHQQDRKNVEAGKQLQISPYWVRLQGRLSEMQDRRKRLIKYLYKKDGKLNEFEEGYNQSISKKQAIIKKFSSSQLEDLLRTSTKNVAQEVVSSIIPQLGGQGILAEIDQALQGTNIINSGVGMNSNQRGIGDMGSSTRKKQG